MYDYSIRYTSTSKGIGDYHFKTCIKYTLFYGRKYSAHAQKIAHKNLQIAVSNQDSTMNNNAIYILFSLTMFYCKRW